MEKVCQQFDFVRLNLEMPKIYLSGALKCRKLNTWVEVQGRDLGWRYNLGSCQCVYGISSH